MKRSFGRSGVRGSRSFAGSMGTRAPVAGALAASMLPVWVARVVAAVSDAVSGFLPGEGSVFANFSRT